MGFKSIKCCSTAPVPLQSSFPPKGGRAGERSASAETRRVELGIVEVGEKFAWMSFAVGRSDG